MPLLGSLLRKTLVARFAQQMAMLLNTGIPFTEAIATARHGTRHRILAEELEAIQRAVEAGSDIAPALAKSRVFPPLVVHLVAVGQNAGELTEMLTQLKTGYQTEVNLAIGKFTAALEPALIVTLAGAIGFVIFATMMPILEATRVMQ
jgi:type II secretory pathway component PulF